MNKIQSFSDLEKLIEKSSGKPKVLEAIWDGDTQGWFLCIMLYTKKLFSTKLIASQIGYISLGNDFRLFTGEVPAWPEAKLAKEIGEKAKLKYGLEFYFPSPDKPDDDCPSYFQKHLAINCADCNKLIIPTDSEYLPKDCCYNCHLTRESNKKIVNQTPYNDGVQFYKVKNNVYTNLGYASDYKSFDIYEYTKDEFSKQITENQISIIKIQSNEYLKSLRKSLCEQTTDALSEYGEPDRNKKGKWAQIHTVDFNDNKYELQPRLSDQHNKIYKLVKIIELLNLVIEDKYRLEFYIKDNFSHRDDAFLRFLKYRANEKTTKEKFIDEFNSLLEVSEIDNTINKLEELKCIENLNNVIKISELGKKVI